jgi:MinD superfamily P-loop ATPase
VRFLIVSIASGKGGTGKTSVAINIAVSIGDAQLIDCDVEEPNAHLLLHPKIVSEEPVYTLVPSINEELCDHCGKCSTFCQYKAIFAVGEIILILRELCHGCGGCILICPKGAINEGKHKIGAIKRGHKDNLELIYGELEVGEPMATPS